MKKFILTAAFTFILYGWAAAQNSVEPASKTTVGTEEKTAVKATKASLRRNARKSNDLAQQDVKIDIPNFALVESDMPPKAKAE